MNKNAKKFMSISIWTTTIFLLVRLLISWTDIKDMWESNQLLNLCYNCFGYIGEAIITATVFMTVFNKWGWKWKWLRWTHNIPILSKSYIGIFKSDYDNVERTGNVIINQTFLTVTVQMKTEESTSRSLTASFKDEQGIHRLIYTYQNDPNAEIQDSSPIHYGTVLLIVNNSLILEGNYFTGRKSRGSIRFESNTK